mmetsp:Transcript_20811/g.29809  ORF Transcript_20811/g.29809 Transcript_20811/m.29809 type:complete len:381 (+) Transcript_20811:122-1264(+)
MKQYNIILVWLVSSCCCQFIFSFSVPKKYDCCSRGLAAHRVENNEAELDRRRFLVTAVIGASSVLAVPDNASAANDEDKSSNLVASAATDVPAIDTKTIFNKAAKRALGGGKAGAAAAVVQVLSLMWLRTAMNYQYRYGGTLGSSLKELYGDGGVPRLYQGLPFAIVQGPLTRFGDTAANVGILALLESIPETASLPLPLKTLAGSLTAGAWRILLMPIDTSKTAMQVEGADGLEKLKQQVIDVGPSPLYQGALASAAATAAGHFPWYLTYNSLNDYLPVISKQDDLLLFLVRSAALGLVSSSVSDTVSNSLRVIKTTKQTAGLGDAADKEITYREALALVLETDGVAGLFGRGLQTRLLTNAIQGAVFSVLWKYFQTSL